VETSGSRLVPSLRYRDIEAAIEWLGDAFGFEEHSIAADLDGTIRHAQLVLGCDMIMLLPAAPPQVEGPAKQPDESASTETHSLYFVVDDAEAHYQKAIAAGAELIESGQYAFDGGGYACRDPEGHVWHFGTFNPRLERAEDGTWIREFLYGKRAQSLALRLRERLNPPVLVAAVVAVVVAVAAASWTLLALSQTSANAREKGLASKALSAPLGEESAVRSLARIDTRAKAGNPPADSTPAPGHVESAPEPPAPRSAEAERLNRPAIASPAVASIEAPRHTDPGADLATQKSTDQTTEEVLGKLRETRRPPEQTGALREATVAAPAQEGKDQATSSPEAHEQAARERAAKESAAKESAARKAERTRKEARSWWAETQRVKPSPAEPVKAPTRSAQEPGADAGGWECLPSPPSGQIVCHPPGKRRAPAKATSPAAKQQLFAVEVVAEPPQQEPRQVPSLQPGPDQGTAAIWDCQPAAPDGQIVCRPR
jgi:uncharacterized glyoxalase superfamily protein PhnB